MRWISAYQTEQRQRDRNEDALFADDSLGIYIVADGVGGSRGGHLASEIVVTDLTSRLRSARDDAPDRSALLRDALEATNQQLLDVVSHHADYPDMSTTVVTACLAQDVAYIGHAGDSRAYLIRGWAGTSAHRR